MMHDVNCLKAKTDEEFSSHLERLVTDTDLRARLGKEAKALAERESIPVQARILEVEYKKLLTL
jgi:hypothetical protein